MDDNEYSEENDDAVVIVESELDRLMGMVLAGCWSSSIEAVLIHCRRLVSLLSEWLPQFDQS
jgi:hypothetical protein